MTDADPLLCRYVELAARTDREVQLTVKIPLAAARHIDGIAQRYGLHSLRLYRDAFELGLRNYLEDLARARGLNS